MRLSDLIKKGSDGDGEGPGKKPASPPPAKDSEDASGGEEPFRLSELPDIGKPQEAQIQKVAPEEERPIELPDFSRESPGINIPFDSPSHSETAAPPPGTSPAPDEPASPEPGPKKLRKSVLMGPDTGNTLDEDSEENRLANIPENPFAPLQERALGFVTAMFQSVNDHTAYPLNEAEEIICDCIEDPEAINHLYSLAVSSKDTTNSLAVHLFNHTVYALKLGQGLRWPDERLIRLGVASLIHEIGMCQVPQAIRHKEGKLTPGEITEIQNHCKYGMEAIMELYGEPFRWLAEAVYHEHEREDGQGYPQGLSGNQISEYAKVIGLADVYEALTHNRPQRKRLLPHKAVQEIVQTQKAQFHQKLLKIMLEELSVFSLNSFVRLNSNAIGRVTETIRGQPLRPVIQLLFDADGNEITEERIIALREFPLLYIVDEVEDSELPTS
jgi:HD-GYP domain-containing protein (c-di-GMP phosphodiesterase class II)